MWNGQFSLIVVSLADLYDIPSFISCDIFSVDFYTIVS